MQVYVSNREIEQIAEGLVEVSCGKPPPKCIDIDRIARFLGITVVYEQIAEDDPDMKAITEITSSQQTANVIRLAPYCKTPL